MLISHIIRAVSPPALLAEVMRRRELESFREHNIVVDAGGRVKAAAGCAVFAAKPKPRKNDDMALLQHGNTEDDANSQTQAGADLKQRLWRMGSSSSSLTSLASAASGQTGSMAGSSAASSLLSRERLESAGGCTALDIGAQRQIF